jgi:hypothetical protein
MELKLEEIYDQDSQEIEGTNNNINYINYWSNANKIINESSNTKKPKVSYDDILSSLNMVVNNGVLQFAKPLPQNKNQETQQQKKQVTIRESENQQYQLAQNNYIMNKYFKDYQQQNEVEEAYIPKTKEEYRQMLIQDYINRQEAQRRISQIKSRKLLFDTRNIKIAAPNQMPRDMNKLFKPFIR